MLNEAPVRQICRRSQDPPRSVLWQQLQRQDALRLSSNASLEFLRLPSFFKGNAPLFLRQGVFIGS